MKLTFFGSRVPYANEKITKTVICDSLDELDPDYVLTNLCAPIGMLVAKECVKRKIPYTIYQAYSKEHLAYSSKIQQEYKRYLRKASSIIQVDRLPEHVASFKHPDVYEKSKYITRDIEICDQMLAGDRIVLVYKKDAPRPLIIKGLKHSLIKTCKIDIYSYNKTNVEHFFLEPSLEDYDDIPF